MFEIAVLPWLEIKEEWEVGRVRFVPYHKGTKPFESGTEQQVWLDTIFQLYRDLRGNPIENACVGFISDREPLEEFREQDRSAIRLASQSLAFASLANNEYFHWILQSANTSVFETHFHRSPSPPQFVSFEWTARPDGSNLDIGYKYDEMLIVMPPEAKCSGFPRPCCTFTQVLYDALGSGYLDGRLFEAVTSFNRAFAYYPGYSIQERVIAVEGSFERLLGHWKAQVFLPEFANKFKPAEEISGDKSRRVTAMAEPDEKTARRKEKYKGESIRAAWLRDFNELRSELAHGKAVSQKVQAWNPHEHLLLAAFAFPLLVKQDLAGEGKYELDEDDVARIDTFEDLADCDLKPPDDSGNECEWHKILGLERFKYMEQQIEGEKSYAPEEGG